MEAIFGTKALLSKSGEVSPSDALKDVKLVGIYFSMHHCPPCREFTPVFADLYSEINADGKVLEVVFFSGDKTDEDYNKYFAEMPWLAVPRGDPRVAAVAKKFEVRGVPRLIILKADGTVVDDNAVKKVLAEGPAAIEGYLNA
jgi:nucleoredoxin